jgi:glycosyltransferase involved in cell wall biosynthesis
MEPVIGIDARAAAEEPAGRGRYVRELLRGLAGLDGGRYVLYARTRWEDATLDERFRWRLIGLPDPLWHLAAAGRASRGVDALLSTNSYLTAWFTLVPTAPVVFDLVPFVQGAQAQSRAARIERATIRPALRRAAALPCISEATRRDLVELFPAAEPTAVTIPLAADERFATARPGDAPARHGLDRPYVLAVGALEPRKNLERLVAAWGRLPSGLRDGHRLALVGPRGWDDEPILRAAAEGGARLLGRVDDADLAALYAGCAAFAYPSLYEGFGLPVLEAMAAGAPVVTSSVSSLPEVAGGAALLVDPHDTDAIAGALARVLGDAALAADLRARGRKRAAVFSWERTARETRELLYGIARTRS